MSARLESGARFHYMPDRVSKQSRDATRARKIVRGLRAYLLAPTVFSAALLATDSLIGSALGAVLTLGLSHGGLERRAPYLDGLAQSRFAYYKGLVLGNAGAGLCTMIGVFAGHAIAAAALASLGLAPSLPAVFGVGTPVESAAGMLAWSLPVLLLADLFIYGYHRAVHRSGDSFRWRMHSIHHSIPVFSIALGARAHPLETITTYCLCGTAGALLGVGMPASFCAGFFVLCFMSPHHINCDVELGPLERVFVTTEAHRWHHNVDHRDSGNYSLLFSFWDRLLGTYHEPERFSGRLGVDVFGDDFPEAFRTRLLLPLPSRWARLTRDGTEPSGAD